MNNKFMFVFFIMLNLISIIVNLQLGNSGYYSDLITDNFNVNIDNSTKEVIYDGNLRGNFGDAFYNSTKPETGIVTTTLSTFIDSIKLVIGVIALLTPFPFVSVMISLNLYWLVTTIISLILIAFWVIGILEFLRGVEI